MDALTLLIIRHAEKPGDGTWPGPGLTAAGAPDDKSLVIRGWQRAGAWAAFFGQAWSPTFPVPAQVYAATPSDKKPDHGASNRPFETATPLAARLGVTLNTQFAKGDEAALAAQLVTLSGVVLVAWEHKSIVSGILPNLPVASGTPPTDWPGDRFDVVLSFVATQGAAGFAYQMLCPQLMSGDSATGF